MMVEFDVADNVTIFMVLVVTTVLFLIALIWAKCKDSRDVHEQKPHWMKDNLVEDHYFYEVALSLIIQQDHHRWIIAPGSI